MLYVGYALPKVPEAENIKAPTDSASIANGKYLAQNVALCVDCHSQRDWSLTGGPVDESKLGAGSLDFIAENGFPGNFYARDISPTSLSSWTDGEILRAITQGINKHGKALFPIMPYMSYSKLDKEDLLDIIGYIRTLPAQSKVITNESEPAFPLNFILNTMPRDLAYSKKPTDTNSVEYGKYIATFAACGDCHTNQEKGQPIKGMEYAGGFVIQNSKTTAIKSANITPDMETGIGKWSEDYFVEMFKSYSKEKGFVSKKVEPGQFNTVMPWIKYSGMKESDLRALYKYLRTLKPINNKIVKEQFKV